MTPNFSAENNINTLVFVKLINNFCHKITEQREFSLSDKDQELGKKRGLTSKFG